MGNRFLLGLRKNIGIRSLADAPGSVTLNKGRTELQSREGYRAPSGHGSETRVTLIGMGFNLVVDYRPRGDQGQAIEELYRGILDGDKHQVLLGVTGSGKTFTMAKVIEKTGRPALVLAHNKTLAAQSITSSGPSSHRTQSNISSATTITTSRKPTFRPGMFTSKKKRPSTMSSTSCGFRLLSRCLNGAIAS